MYRHVKLSAGVYSCRSYTYWHAIKNLHVYMYSRRCRKQLHVYIYIKWLVRQNRSNVLFVISKLSGLSGLWSMVHVYRWCQEKNITLTGDGNNHYLQPTIHLMYEMYCGLRCSYMCCIITFPYIINNGGRYIKTTDLQIHNMTKCTMTF